MTEQVTEMKSFAEGIKKTYMNIANIKMLYP